MNRLATTFWGSTIAGPSALLVPMLLAAPALASSAEHGGAHGGGGEPHINWWAFDAHAPAVGWLLVDFAIVIFMLVYFARKPLHELLQTRAGNVRRAIEEATRAKEAAEARAKELEARLAQLDQELANLRDDIQRSGEKERAQLEADGKLQAERLARDTESQIQSEVTRARALLKADAVQLAMQLAEQQLAKRLGPSEQQALNKAFVANLKSAPSGQSGAPQ